MNDNGLFDSDYEASKVAGHELKGAQAYYELELKARVPFMCLVDYLGYRLVCMTTLPIGTPVPDPQTGGPLSPAQTTLAYWCTTATERLRLC